MTHHRTTSHDRENGPSELDAERGYVLPEDEADAVPSQAEIDASNGEGGYEPGRFAVACDILRTEAQRESLKHRTESQEYRDIKRAEEAAALASGVAYIIAMVEKDPATHGAETCAKMVQRMLSEALAQATRAGHIQAANAISALKA